MDTTYIFKHTNTSNLVIIVAKEYSEAKKRLADRFAIPKEFELIHTLKEDDSVCTITLKELEKARDEVINAQIDNIIGKM